MPTEIEIVMSYSWSLAWQVTTQRHTSTSHCDLFTISLHPSSLRLSIPGASLCSYNGDVYLSRCFLEGEVMTKHCPVSLHISLQFAPQS